MGNFKLSRDPAADPALPSTGKEKLKDVGKNLQGKSTKKQLPLLPLSQHHVQQHHTTVASQSLPSLFTIASSSASTSSSPTVVLPSTSVPMPSSSSNSMQLLPALLREILHNIAAQRNQIVALINTIDPTILTSTYPKSLQEHKLLNQIVELQGKILDMHEEIHHMRVKNTQLEQQLSLLQGRRGAQA